MFVKICGIKTPQEAHLCADLGATAIGVIVGALHKTEDEISPKQVRCINQRDFCKILVTHLEDPEVVLDLAVKTACNAIQLHSDMPVKDIEKVRKRFSGFLIGIAHGNSSDVFDRTKELVRSGVIDILLIDTRTIDRVGGTGVIHDWSITAKIRETYPEAKIVVAGGLNPENVGEAIKIIRPYGVDVNTGVKGANGFKDPKKVRRFIIEAKNKLAKFKNGR